MSTRFQKMKWDLHCKKARLLTMWGLINGCVMPYDDELIERLRKVYYGGIPASVMLLSNAMTNGHCYDRALLMARAFLGDDDDVQLLYASINSLRLNPKFTSDSPLYADHCIVERTTKDGRHLIYDTSSGFIYDKKFYWLIEKPKVRKVNSKESIKNFIEEDEARCPEDIDRDRFIAPLVLPMIESTFGRPTELYAGKGIELLQREIEYYKNAIKYDDVVEEIDRDMKRIGLRK